MLNSLSPFNSLAPFNTLGGQTTAVTFLEALASWVSDQLDGPEVYLGYLPQSVLLDDAIRIAPIDKQIYLDISGRSLKARRTGFEVECRSTVKSTARTLAGSVDTALDRQTVYVSGHRFVDCQLVNTRSGVYRHQNAWVYSTTLHFDLYHYEAVT